jgi:hypothetical protein
LKEGLTQTYAWYVDHVAGSSSPTR